jgi:hypothetical protein
MFPSGIALAITARYSAGHCRSPIEMSLASPIEMSLGQAVVETFGVACDDGDPNERTGADAASCADRFVGQAADGLARGTDRHAEPHAALRLGQQTAGRFRLGAARLQPRGVTGPLQLMQRCWLRPVTACGHLSSFVRRDYERKAEARARFPACKSPDRWALHLRIRLPPIQEFRQFAIGKKSFRRCGERVRLWNPSPYGSGRRGTAATRIPT